MLLNIIAQTLQIGWMGLTLTGIGIVISIIGGMYFFGRGIQRDINEKLGKTEFINYTQSHESEHTMLKHAFDKQTPIILFKQEQENVRAIIATMKMEVGEYRKDTKILLDRTATIANDISWIKDEMQKNKD